MARRKPDSCPGVLTLHQAADGALARVRLPGGALLPAQLQALADAARDVATGALELTSRGNIQLRAVRDAPELARRLTRAGLLPSATHERIRNIVASPLSGRVGGLADVRTLVRDLDGGLQSRPALAALPGRVLFTVDDGRGDVSALGGDIGLHAVAADEFAVVLAAADTGIRVPRKAAVETMLRAAEAFAAIRSDEWRLADVAGGVERVLARLGAVAAPAAPLRTAADRPVGWFDHADGTVSLGAGVPLGTLTARLADFLAAADRQVVVTPWRGVVLCDLDEGAAEQVVRVLAPMGLIFDAASPWLTVTACAGLPGCASARTDVRGDVAAALEHGALPVAGPQHWSACERRCGRPRGPVADVVALPDPAGPRVPIAARYRIETGTDGDTPTSDPASGR